MIFNEVYGIYYNVVGKILKEAVKGEISLDKIKEITGKEAFGESITVIPDKLLKKQWPLMDDNFETPLKNNPDMPLTTIEKMWLRLFYLTKELVCLNLLLTDLRMWSRFMTRIPLCILTDIQMEILMMILSTGSISDLYLWQ